MLPFILYFGAGLATALHVFARLHATASGSASEVLEWVSLLGSAGLLVAACTALIRSRLAARIALIAALLCWCFYAPAAAGSVRAGHLAQAGNLRSAFLPLLALILLALATAYSAAVSFRKKREEQRSSWFDPEAPATQARIALAMAAVIAVLGLSWFLFGAPLGSRASARFLIPAGYVGWVRVEFGVPGARALPNEGAVTVFAIPADGVLRTSSPARGRNPVEFYYQSSQGLEKLSAASGGARMIWGRMNGQSAGLSGLREYEQFFVGSGEQFKEQAGAGRAR